MKNLKFLLVAFMVSFTIAAKAQDVNSKGFTTQVYVGSYKENGETKTFDVNDVYNVSLTDKFLIHNVMDGDGIVTDSQFYKVSNLKVESVSDMPTFTFDATSGISGNTYKYTFTFIGTVASVDRTQPDGSVDTFIGISVILKTYQQ